MKIAVSILVALASSIPLSATAARPVQPPPPPTVSGMNVYAAGQHVGYVLSMYRGSYGDYLTLISATGYLADFYAETGAFLTFHRPTQIVYTGLNCTGDAYAHMPDTSAAWRLQQGMVFALGSQTYYTSRGVTQPLGAEYWSARGLDGSCGNANTRMSVQPVAPAFLNDVAITRIPSEGLTQPIVFGIP